MDLARALRIGIYTGIFAIPFIGLIVANNFFFPFISGKNFTFRIIVEIIFALWAVLALMSPEYRPKKSAALLIGGAFVLSLGISTVLAENPSKAFWSNFERMEGYITLIHLAMYVTVLTTMMKTEELWKKFFLTSIGASVIIALYGCLQLAGAFTINQGGVRVDGTFGNATYLAVYMLIHAFVTILALFRWTKGSRLTQVLLSVALLLQITMVFYAATRGTILGLVGGLLLAGLIFTFSRGAGNIRRIGIGFIIAVVVAGGIFFAVKDTEYVQNHAVLSRIASISLAQGETRFTIWSMALSGFYERPLFGWGQEGFNFVFNEHYVPTLYNQEPWFDRAHNILLDWLVAGGIVGAVLYLSLYGVLIYYLWRPRNSFDISERAVLTGLLAGYAFHNIFVFDNLMSYVLFMALFSYITVRSVPQTGWGTPLPATTSQIALPVAGIALAVVLYSANVPGIASATGLIQALSPQSGGVPQNFEILKGVVDSSDGLGRQEVHEQLLQFATQVAQLNAGDAQFTGEVATYARDKFLVFLEDHEGDARLQVFIGSFLRQFGDYDGAVTHLEKAVELSPQKQLILFELGTALLGKKDLTGALEVYRRAYDAAPTYEFAQMFYAVGAMRAKDLSLADSVLERHYGTVIVDNVTLLQGYLELKMLDRAVMVAELRVQNDPTNLQKLQQLSGVYMEAGRRADAISTLEKAIELDPSFKEQGTQFIEGIRQGTI